MSSSSKFDKDYYLSENPDVAVAIEKGVFKSEIEHFEIFGGAELRSPNEIFVPSYYLLQNLDVAQAVETGFLRTGFEHFQIFGEKENRIPSSVFEGFDPESYILANPDVASALEDGVFGSALDHFLSFGQFENRLGSGIQQRIFSLTVNQDNYVGTVGDDEFFARPDTLNIGDILDGRGGRDTLSIETSESDKSLLVFPSVSNLIGIENISISAEIHQSLDFSGLESISEITIKNGKTRQGENLVISIGKDQDLNLNNLKKDNSLNSSLLADGGGLIINQDENANVLKLSVDQIGPSLPNAAENILIDFSNQKLATLYLAVSNDNSMVLVNSGGTLSSLEISGSGSLQLSEIPRTVTSLNGVSSNINFNLATRDQNVTINTGQGNDHLNLGQGQSTVDLGAGNDSVTVLGGVDISSVNTIRLGTGNDSVTVLGGIDITIVNYIFLGTGDDTADVLGGSNTINLGAGDDTVNISSGTNTIVGGEGGDQINVRNGTNNIISGADDDSVTVNGGINSVKTGLGNDSLVVTGGRISVDTGEGDDNITISEQVPITIEALDAGAGTDTLSIFSTGTVTVPAVKNIENFFLSDTVHQSLDFSFSATLVGIELDSGTTIDGSTITTTLREGQSLTIDGITDGDTAAASLADGGIVISQDSSITSLNLTLDDVGPATSVTNENVFIDIAGTGVSTMNVTSGNDSFVVISNSGGALTSLGLLGSGTMALGTLPTSITNVNGASATANLTLTIGSGGTNTIRGGTGNDAITLTGGVNDVDTGDGDDTITTSTNLVVGDRIDGGNGTDTFEVIHTGLANIPSTANLSNIERIAIQDTVHQTLDFSSLTTITGVELDSGTTVNGATITTTLSASQSLTLDSITDGDSAAASLADGGIKIAQANSITSLDLTLDDIGPGSSNTNTNLFIDIAGTGVATANVTSANTSFIVLENSGNALNTLNLTGSGTLGIQGTLANSITTINGLNSSANLAITSGTGDDTITGGSGNDTITLTGGTNNVTGGDGNDVIILSTGNDTVVSGNGNDDITAAGGTNNITTGANNDEVTLTGGNNTVNTGNNNDEVTISGGTNNIDTGSGNDQITISGGANTVVTGSNNDTVNVSNGNNDIETGSGSDQVTLTGGTNDVDTGDSSDTVTLGGVDTVNTGSGDDTVDAAATLTTADTVNGGSGTGDIIKSTVAITDALAARLSNFEVFDITGGGGITHDISDLTGLTSLKVSGSITGNISITDLATAAEVDISGAIGNNLTINQINAVAGGSDSLTFDFSGSTYTTGGSIIAANIETVTLQTSAGGTKTVSGATFANAGTLNITASSADLTILDLTAVTLQTFDVSSTSSRTTNITAGADVFSNALTYTGGGGSDTLDLDGATLQNTFAYNGGNGGDTLELDNATLQNTFSYDGGSGDDTLSLGGAALSGALTFEGGSGNDTVTLDGATLAAGTVFVVGDDQDTLTLNADAVASVVRTSAINSNNAFSIRDDAGTADTAGFTPGSDTFDYNGSLSHDSNTLIVKAAGATLQAAVAADADATVYVIQDADGDADFETALNLFADGVSNSKANTMETEAIDTGLLSYSGLDTAFDSSDIVLIAIDAETNEDGSLANNGGSAIYRFNNSNTSTVDTILSTELELIGVFQDAALGVSDFI